MWWHALNTKKVHLAYNCRHPELPCPNFLSGRSCRLLAVPCHKYHKTTQQTWWGNLSQHRWRVHRIHTSLIEGVSQQGRISCHFMHQCTGFLSFLSLYSLFYSFLGQFSNFSSLVEAVSDTCYFDQLLSSQRRKQEWSEKAWTRGTLTDEKNLSKQAKEDLPVSARKHCW